jgi:hypothetical protein
VATEPSSLGNPEGKSEARTFVVDTAPPTVTISQPASPSSNTEPSFTGTASDTKPVKVQIYLGKAATGTVVWEKNVEPTAKGEWATPKVSPPLSSVKPQAYTAVASQESSIGNPTGKSPTVTFVVDSAAPTVTLRSLPAQSNDNAPSFSGTASTTTPVTVKIYAGLKTEPPAGPVAQAGATVNGGAWSSERASPALPDGLYTALAYQVSATGHEGGSAPIQFIVDTAPPHPAITYPADGASALPGSQLVEGSAGTAPGDLPNVTVRLFGGDGTTILQSIVVKAVGGKWSATFGGLPAGHYIVRAEQGDEAGNLETTPPRSFALAEPVAAPAKQMLPPSAALAWFPVAPHTGEPVSLVSSSTDSGSPITSFAWDLAGNGAFQPGGQVLKTAFTAPGNHTVRLRVADANGLASVASATIPVTSPVAPLMRPYPTVRLLTTRIAGGIRLRQLTVLAPSGARIVISCRSRRCPVKPQSLAVKPGTRGAIEFKRFQRSLRIGVVLEIRVSQPGVVGKYTRLTVRKGKPPSRFDSCLSPNGTIPIACPLS